MGTEGNETKERGTRELRGIKEEETEMESGRSLLVTVSTRNDWEIHISTTIERDLVIRNRS